MRLFLVPMVLILSLKFMTSVIRSSKNTAEFAKVFFLTSRLKRMQETLKKSRNLKIELKFYKTSVVIP